MISIGQPIEIVKKGWGEEVVIVNNSEYCGKLLIFKAGAKFSVHFHVLKHETFYVLHGRLTLTYFDLRTGESKIHNIYSGDVVTIPRHEPHRLEAVEDSTIIEFSTHHEDSDSYRIAKGDSQK